MRIAFVGKGGSGKTTLAAVFARHLAGRGAPVLALDADINQHLAEALGFDERPVPPALSADPRWLKDHLRGDNPRVPDAAMMIKTTPPGRGSRQARLDADDPVLARHAARLAVPGGGEVLFMAAGEIDREDVGVSCYHAKTGTVELYLNHLVDGPGEYVVVDMTAGADAFASGLFTRFDLTVLVSEPTRRGTGVWEQYRRHASEHGVRLRAVGNKVADLDDEAYLVGRLGEDLLACVGRSAWVRAAERGRPGPLRGLEPENRTALDAVAAELDSVDRDWVAYHRNTVEFHLRNARAWANESVGADLAGQVDPGFVPGPTPSSSRRPAYSTGGR